MLTAHWQGRWGGGVFESEYVIDCLGDYEMELPFEWLKDEVLDLRAKLREQEKRRQEESVNEQSEGSSFEILVLPSCVPIHTNLCSSHAEVGNENVGKTENTAPAQQTLEQEEEDEWRFDVSLYNPRFPTAVCRFLEDGVLEAFYELHSPVPATLPWTDQGQYGLVLVGYCAMQLGCVLPRGFLASLKANLHVFRDTLFPAGMEQMRKACEDYIDGKPFDFPSFDDVENLMAQVVSASDPETPGLETVPPGSSTASASSGQQADASFCVVEYCFWFPPGTCANCGSPRGFGNLALKRCKGCKDTLYCFEGCQKWHWSRHKRHCEEAQQRAGELEAVSSVQEKNLCFEDIYA